MEIQFVPESRDKKEHMLRNHEETFSSVLRFKATVFRLLNYIVIYSKGEKKSLWKNN